MQSVEFVCERCQKDDRAVLTGAATQEVVCPHCGHTRTIEVSQSMRRGGPVDRCVICSRIRFYVQKDFNPRLGLLIFFVGVLFSYHTYFISLAVATLVDFILYKVLKTVTVCYHCRAVYRGFEEDLTHRGFDHELAASLVEQDKPDSGTAVQPTAGVSG